MRNLRYPASPSARARQNGFTLTELIVALALGLFLVGGIISLFVSNQGNFKTNESLSRLQESARFGVELLSREIREAGSNPCGVRAVNSLIREDGVAATSVPWWADWNAGTVRGLDGAVALTGHHGVQFGTGVDGRRVPATDGIITLRTAMEEEALHLVQNHNTATAVITLDRLVTQYKDGQAVMMCDSSSGVVFQLTDDPAGSAVEYENTSRSNCSTQMGWTSSVNCNTSATHKQFAAGSFLTKYDPAFWYVGISNVAEGRRSLYRATVRVQTISGSKIPTIERREMVPDVTDMQIEYLVRANPAGATASAVLSTNWVPASDAQFNAGIGGWSAANTNEAIAARVTLTLESRESVGTNAAGTSNQKLTRQSVFLVNLRNREIVPKK
jgi:type IV pilus assembly protein PilW